MSTSDHKRKLKIPVLSAFIIMFVIFSAMTYQHRVQMNRKAKAIYSRKDIAYARGNNLYLLNITTGDSTCIPANGIVASPTFDNSGRNVYFLSNTESGAENNHFVTCNIFKYDIDAGKLSQVTSKRFDNLWLELPTHLNLFFDKSDVLFLTMFDLENVQMFQIDTKQNQLQVYDSEQALESRTVCSDSLTFNGTVIVNRKTEGIYELVLQKSDGTLTRLSHTVLYKRDSELLDEKARFVLSPDRKSLVFAIVTEMGDFLHGPLFSVDLDGKHQTHLLEDGFDRIAIQETYWISGSSFLYIDDNGNLMSVNVIGEKKLIRKHVSAFTAKQ